MVNRLQSILITLSDCMIARDVAEDISQLRATLSIMTRHSDSEWVSKVEEQLIDLFAACSQLYVKGMLPDGSLGSLVHQDSNLLALHEVLNWSSKYKHITLAELVLKTLPTPEPHSAQYITDYILPLNALLRSWCAANETQPTTNPFAPVFRHIITSFRNGPLVPINEPHHNLREWSCSLYSQTKFCESAQTSLTSTDSGSSLEMEDIGVKERNYVMKSTYLLRPSLPNSRREGNCCG